MASPRTDNDRPSPEHGLWYIHASLLCRLSIWHPPDNTESHMGLMLISWQGVALHTLQNQACLLTRTLCRRCAQDRADGGRHTRQWRAAEARRRNPGRSRRVSHALTAAPGARCARMHLHPLTVFKHFIRYLYRQLFFGLITAYLSCSVVMRVLLGVTMLPTSLMCDACGP